MRVLVGGLHHESDSLNPHPTALGDIRVRRGIGLFSRQSEDALGGIISALAEAGVEVVPALHARAIPGGLWTDEAYRNLADELVGMVASSLPLDGICLALHGSMRSQSEDDCEGEILERIHSLWPDIPIYASLDTHGTLTDRMLANACAFAAYKCAPHTDAYETGRLAASMLVSHLQDGTVHHMAAFRLPMLIAGEKSETGREPMLSLCAMLRKEEEEGASAASWLLGFPWADSPTAGVSALVVSPVSMDDAYRRAVRLARAFWSCRYDFSFCTQALGMDETVEEARRLVQEGACPLVISDSGDNPTAGARQEMTSFLARILCDPFLSSLPTPPVYQAFHDSAIVEEALENGPGSGIMVSFGVPRLSGRAIVKAVCPDWCGDFSSALALVGFGGIDIVFSQRRVGCYEPGMLRALGLEPSSLSVLVVKLGYLEPELKALASSSLLALTEGDTDEVLERIAYKRIPRPIFPLDEPEVLFPEA